MGVVLSVSPKRIPILVAAVVGFCPSGIGGFPVGLSFQVHAMAGSTRETSGRDGGAHLGGPLPKSGGASVGFLTDVCF